MSIETKILANNFCSIIICKQNGSQGQGGDAGCCLGAVVPDFGIRSALLATLRVYAPFTYNGFAYSPSAAIGIDDVSSSTLYGITLACSTSFLNLKYIALAVASITVL